MESETEVPEVVKQVVEDGGGLALLVVGVFALGVGVGIGYILGRRKKPYEVIKLGDRLPTMPPKVVIDADVAHATKAFSRASEAVDEMAVASKEVTVTVNEEAVKTNIFATAETVDDWNYDSELEKRDPLGPYVIHADEFHAQEMAEEGYVQSQLTFYAGDEVLFDDEEGKPIHNHDMVVGPLLFGHGSDDPNVVYVRNMTRNMEYEITRDPGHYRVEILGLEMEHQETEAEKRRAKRQQQRLRPE